jgi:RNA polymerase sigma-70 factor (ECF subfamily)
VNPTSVSLLDRLKAAGPDDADWLRFQDIYLPLLRQWLGRVPGLGDEASDLAQEVFLVVVRELPRFQRRREGSFRAWLRQVTVNKVWSQRKRRRRQADAGREPDATDQYFEQLADPRGDLAQEWDRDHDQHVFQELLAIVQPDFSPTVWEAFCRFARQGHPAAQVAEELGLSVNAVLQAKSRILRRLRQEAGNLLD